MDEVANVSPRRRKVRCPKCRALLSEPESPIYQCPFCLIFLLAKGVPPDFRWQMPINEGNQGIENSQQTNELEAKSIIVTELIRSQSLNDQEINEHVSLDGNNMQQDQLLSETESVVKNKSEQEPQLENDCGNKSTSVGDNDMLADYASKISTTNGEEGMALDCVESEGALVSNSGVPPEIHVLLDHTIPQLPLKDAGSCSKQMQTNELKAKSIDGTELIRSESQDQHNDHEINEHVSIDGNIRQQEQLLSETGSVVKNKRERDLQLENDCGNKSTSVGDNDMSADYASKIKTTNGEEGMAMDCVENEGAVASNSGVSPETHLLLDHTIPQLLLKDAGNCSMPSAREEKKDFVGVCHCDNAGEGNEQNFESEIIRDNDYELSFKYISALESNAQLAPRKRTPRFSNLSSKVSVRLRKKPSQLMNAHLTERCPFSSDENSDEYESYSSASESASHDSVDSEFDFPSPSAQSMQIPNLLDLLFQQKMPLPDVHCAAPPNPHQLEWQDVDHENVAIAFQNSNGAPSTPHQLECQDVDPMNKEIPLQNSNGAVPSSVEVDAKTVSDVPNGVDQGDQVERTKVERHLQKETFSVGLQGSVDSKERDNTETEEDFDGYQKSLSYQLKKHKPMLTNDLQEGLSGSLDLLSSGAEHSSKLKSSAICIEKIQERSSDPLHLRQNVPFSDANNQSQRASTSGNMSTKRDFESAHAAQKNMEPESVGMQSFPLVTEQGTSSSHSAVNNSESQLYHRRNYSSEARQGGNREGTVNTFDSRLHHRSNYSEETQVQSKLSNTYTSRVQKNTHNEGLHMLRPTRILEESSKIHQRHAEGTFELGDGQGSWLQKQNRQADMHAMEHSMNFSGPSNGFSPGNVQPLGFTHYTNGSDSFARGVPNASLAFTYEAPSHPWMLPVMPGIHHGCHSAAPVCMACIHYQHSHLPQLPMPPCGLCLPLVHQQWHTGWCNHHHAHQIQVSDQQAHVACCSPPCFPRQTVHIHDTAMDIGKPLVPSPRKPKHYPPLPRGSTAPYIICKGCDVILEVPTDIPLRDTEAQKVRCGACNKVAKFSMLKDSQATCNVALESSTINKAPISTSHAIQHTEHSRPPPVSNVVQSMDSSFYQVINSGFHPPYKHGSFDSQQQISAASKRRGSLSLDEIVQATKCEVDSSDQDEFFFRILSKHSEFDSSRIFFNGFKSSSSVLGASNIDGLPAGNDMLLQAPVDEKEEGLDFGAPRMSDGESLGQRSPESRMRSPENKQHVQLLDQKRHTKGSRKDEEYMELKRKMIAEGKKPSRSLFALLNQESSKFDISMDESLSFDESTSALCSTASSSTMADDHTRERYNAGDCGTFQTCNVTSKGFGRRGPKYIAVMLGRSLKDFRRENQ